MIDKNHAPQPDDDVVGRDESVDVLIGTVPFVGHTDEIELWVIDKGRADWFKVAAYDRREERWCGRIMCNSFRFFERASTLDRKSCHKHAQALAERVGFSTDRGFHVGFVEVDAYYQRQGIAIGLYTAALMLAAERKGVLMSDRCLDGGETSRLGKRVWSSSSFAKIAILADGGLSAVLRPDAVRALYR